MLLVAIVIASGAAILVGGLGIAARWPAWKAGAAAWFRSEKSALAARAEGRIVDVENRLKALETMGLDTLRADVAALKTKVGV